MVYSPTFGPARRGFLGRLRQSLGGGQRRAGLSSRRLHLELLESRELLSGFWTPLATAAPSSDGIGTMLLLSDGTVMAQGGGSSSFENTWYKLTPDASGSYINGTWSKLASMHFTRLYYGSSVMPDGRIFVVGGEYSNAGSDTNTGEIYNPVTNTWQDIKNFPQANFGDDPTEVLPDGRILGGYLLGPQTYIYDPSSNSWTQAGTKLMNDNSDEESWLKLPDSSILSYDICVNNPSGCTRGNAQRYVPSTNTWVATGPGPNNLSGSNVGYELGPGALLPDGRVFLAGATNHTALYNPATDTWASGPDMPSNLGADDAAGVMLPNGHFLFTADRPLFGAPAHLFDFDYTTDSLTELSTTGLGLTGPSYYTRMLMLPSGQALMTNGSSQLQVYTPNEAPDPSWQPVIFRVQDLGGGTFKAVGLQFNGISEGATYGDDAQMATNYPIVQLTDANGNVYYARTHDWNNTGVATGYNVLTATYFDLPAGINAGSYSVSVIANGIASPPVTITVPGAVSPVGSLTTTTLSAADDAGTVAPPPSAALSDSPATGVVAALVNDSETTQASSLGTGDTTSQATPLVGSMGGVDLNQGSTSATASVLTATPAVLTPSAQEAALDTAFASDPLGLLS
jgi:hypothetical protein